MSQPWTMVEIEASDSSEAWRGLLASLKIIPEWPEVGQQAAGEREDPYLL